MMRRRGKSAGNHGLSLAETWQTCYPERVDALSVQLEKGIRLRGAALMGVLNVTPDSFFDGGAYTAPAAAAARVDALLAEGADILDVGGESSRPGAEAIRAEEQIARIEPAVRHALARGAVVSIDTTDPAVAERMFALGAHLANDVSCLSDSGLARVCAKYRRPLLLMHAKGRMNRMPGFSVYPDQAYGDVVADVLAEWRAARDRAVAEGLPRDQVWLDPGLGFSKNARHSFAILRGLEHFAREGVPLVLGPSRKSFLNLVGEAPPERRLGGTIAACLVAVAKGASVLRVHDVADVHQALAVARALAIEPAPPEAARVLA